MLVKRSAVSVGQWVVIALLSFTALVLSTGCCGHAIREREIQVTLDDQLVGKPYAVVLYGANAADLDVWTHKSIDDFFKPNDPLRLGTPNLAAVTFASGGKEKTITFPATDMNWQAWKDRKAWNLVALLQVPDADPIPGDPFADPRRQVLPLDQLRWENCGEGPIKLRVHLSSLTTETPPLPAP